MRIDRLDLTAYGIFTDRRLDLSADGLDFHIVAGPNEAGKSTLRNAISELLFGIAAKSPYNFVHDYKDMCLGAVISHRGQTLAFERRKQRKQPLRGADGHALPDDSLTPFLSTIDRSFFERMFGLDHSRLVKGGADILGAKDDVSRMLFEASAGLDSLGEFRSRLEAEASGLWDRRKAKDRAYYRAQERYDEAKLALKATTVRAEAFRQVNQRVENAKYRLEEASEAYQELETERTRVERIRRVASLLQSRNELLERRGELGEVILLPKNAGEQLGSVQQDMAGAQASMDKHQALMESVRARLDAMELDEALLREQEAVTELEALRHQVRAFPADIEKRKAEVALLWQQVERGIAELGWPKSEEAELRSRLPSKVLWAEVGQWGRAHGRLQAELSAAQRTLADRQEELATRAQELASLAVTEVPIALRDALERARALGDVEQQRRQLQRRVREATAARDASIERLRPWVGELDVLRGMTLPAEETIRQEQSQKATMVARMEAARRQFSDTEMELQVLAGKVQQLERRYAPVTQGELLGSRDARDKLWASLREGRVALVAVAQDYERSVAKADELSDRRYQDAAQLKELEQLTDSAELVRLKWVSQDKEFSAAKEELQAAEQRYTDRLQALGLPALDATSLVTWCQHRERALLTATEVATAETELVDFEENVKSVQAALTSALREVGQEAGRLAGLSWGALLSEAEQSVSRSLAASARRAELVRQETQGEAVVESLRSKAAAAEQQLGAWTARWTELLSAIHLGAETSPAGADEALKIFQDLADALDKIATLRSARIAGMERELSLFEKVARELAQRVAPELVALGAEEISAQLSARLKEAQTAARQVEVAKKEMQEHEARFLEAKAALAEGSLRVAPLLKAASVREIGELSAAIMRSEQARALEKAMADCVRSTLDSGDGLGLLELEREVSGVEVSMLAARAAEISEQRVEAIAKRDACLLERKEAEAARDAICGQADAATAAARAEEALSEMASSIERYVKVYIGARLLRWSIDRYREEKQDPLLARASEVFAKLTLGSFERLHVDFDADPPQLLGQRPSGKHVLVDGMSEATRDQLFLALRLAAVELHLRRGLPLPFIADDLFINYDDARAQAGFTVLAELSQHTQVLYLTHHEHLLPLAQAAIGPRLHVHHLAR